MCSGRRGKQPADAFSGMLARRLAPSTTSGPGRRNRPCRVAGQRPSGHSPPHRDAQGECHSGREIVKKVPPCQATEIRPAKRQCCDRAPSALRWLRCPQRRLVRPGRASAPHTRPGPALAPPGPAAALGFSGFVRCVQISIELSAAGARELGEEMRVRGALLTPGVR